MTDPRSTAASTKVCSSCGEELPQSAFHRRRHYIRAGVRAACKACTREAGRRARAEKPQPVDTTKHRVRARTRAAIQRGELSPLPCQVCGEVEVVPHHPSYDGDRAHFEIEWLCRKHHGLEHGKRPWTKQAELFSGLG